MKKPIIASTGKGNGRRSRAGPSRLEYLERRNRELEAVNAIAQIVVSSPVLSDLLEEALRRLLGVMALDAGSIFLLNDSGHTLELISSVGFSSRYARALANLRVGHQFAGKVVAEPGPLVVEDIEQGWQKHATAKSREGMQSFAGVPLHARDRIIGVMDVASRTPRSFDEADLSLLTAVGNQIAVAIENARLYEQNATLAITEERNRLAREVHDTLAQGLIALTIQLELAETALSSSGDSGAAFEGVRKALTVARANLVEARASVSYLRGSVIDRTPLVESLGKLAEEASQRGIRVNVVAPDDLKDLHLFVEDALIGVAREALNNAWKHAHASRAEVSLRRVRGSLRLVIQDDGIGFDPSERIDPAAGGHFGILGMQERVRQAGGQLDVETRPGYGTVVRAVVPLRGRTKGGGSLATAGRSA